MLGVVLAVVTVALAIFSMMNVAMSNMSKNRQMIWFAIVVLIPFVGPIMYFVLQSKKYA